VQMDILWYKRYLTGTVDNGAMSGMLKRDVVSPSNGHQRYESFR
jgi:hypothetical protein